MAFQIESTEDATLEDLSMESSFRSNVESSIAVGLGVEKEQVIVTDIQAVSRRLQASSERPAERRLQYGLLQVEYEVYMSGDMERNRIRNNIDYSGDFVQTFQRSLMIKEKVNGRNVVVDKVMSKSVSISGRTQSVTEARLAAKEKYELAERQRDSATFATSTSTSKKPMITMAEDVSVEQTLEEDNAPATTGAAYKVTLHIFIIAFAMLASRQTGCPE